MWSGKRGREGAGIARAAAPLSAVAAALAMLVPAGSSGASAGPPVRHTGAANRQAAQHDAATLLSRFRLPPGATPLTAEPAGDGGVLAHPGSGAVATPTVIDRHRWWTTTGQHASVISFIRAHAPRGAKLLASGSSVEGPGLPVGRFLAYQWPPRPAVLRSRQLVIAIVDLPGGRTGIRADAQVQWTIPRPADERIPPGVGELDVTRGLPHRAPEVSRHVTNPAEIHRLVAMIDRLQTIQPGAWACPAFPVNAPVVTFTFRSGLGGPPLAVASEPAFATEPTSPCDPMTFSIRGHARKPLLGGAAVVRAAGRMLGVRLHVPIQLS